ncbi:hypothetical protein GOBAR_AA16802 [Gossypium barbadense]|uniref:Uncharacterized protein n=1 Tax=Gossypium barbadense TaxID=3634 RepID=A0A2P5XKJ4_GOSBA|nr:hypothetical protein GOBAR_AA16802 [Gossypium barbadense]
MFFLRALVRVVRKAWRVVGTWQGFDEGSVSLSEGVGKGLNDGSREGLGEGSVGVGKGAGVVGACGEGLADGDVESRDKGENQIMMMNH